MGGIGRVILLVIDWHTVHCHVLAIFVRVLPGLTEEDVGCGCILFVTCTYRRVAARIRSSWRCDTGIVGSFNDGTFLL